MIQTLDIQLVVALIIVFAAICYAVWRVWHAINQTASPCSGCEGCSLKKQCKSEGVGQRRYCGSEDCSQQPTLKT